MRRAIVLVLLVLQAGCASIAPLVTTRTLSWELIQSVGGISVGEPVIHTDNTVFLPVDCNVSGVRKVTVEPTQINSALVVKKVKAKVRGNRIKIQVVTCFVDGKNTATSQGVNLGRVSEGRYDVEYLSPDGSTVSLRSIEVRK